MPDERRENLTAMNGATQRFDRVCCELRAMHRCGRQAAEAGGDRCARESGGALWSCALQTLRHERCGCYGRGTTATEETRFRDLSTVHAHREAQHVAAHRIAHLHRVRRAGQFARVARLAKMVENGFTEHRGAIFLSCCAKPHRLKPVIQQGPDHPEGRRYSSLEGRKTHAFETNSVRRFVGLRRPLVKDGLAFFAH